MLYEGTIRFLQQAMEAIRNEDAEMRFERLNKASEIILALKTALDMSSGSAQAKELDNFYRMIDSRIVALHRTQNLGECADIIERIRVIRDVWDAIDRMEKKA